MIIPTQRVMSTTAKFNQRRRLHSSRVSDGSLTVLARAITRGDYIPIKDKTG